MVSSWRNNRPIAYWFQVSGYVDQRRDFKCDFWKHQQWSTQISLSRKDDRMNISWRFKILSTTSSYFFLLRCEVNQSVWWDNSSWCQKACVTSSDKNIIWFKIFYLSTKNALRKGFQNSNSSSTSIPVRSTRFAVMWSRTIQHIFFPVIFEITGWVVSQSSAEESQSISSLCSLEMFYRN